MTKTDLENMNLQSQYELYNVILFNNSLPRANNIDFILHNLQYAVGYSRYRQNPSKTGNIHEIAFCKYFDFTDRQITEILIHEMIHLWQVTHVAEWRYKYCSNDIAHDKVFTSKMNTINLLLNKKGFDYVIKQVCDDKLILDERIIPSKNYYVFYVENFTGIRSWFKVRSKNVENVIKLFCDKAYNGYFKNVYVKKERNYIHNMMEYCDTIPDLIPEALNFNTNENMYNAEDPNNIWIIKDENLVYEHENSIK